MHPKQQHAPHTNNNKHMMCTCKESSIQSTTLLENKLISSLRCAVVRFPCLGLRIGKRCRKSVGILACCCEYLVEKAEIFCPELTQFHDLPRWIHLQSNPVPLLNLSVGESDQVEADVPNEKGLKPSSPKVKEEEKIYLGPHGAPPSQAKQQELNATGRKQRLKYKLKEADRKFAGTGRENKVENLRELMGSSKANTTNMGKDSPRDWLDPHCHES
ncbi:hypothetical protein ACLOJK_019722 [Asimina triloba]